MSEEYLIRHCAPTLAGLKTAGLFTCPFASREVLVQSLRKLNRQLGAKGLRLLPLRISGKKALIYLYRPAMLRRDLRRDLAAQLLEQAGYDPENCEKCVACLSRKLRGEEAFPHEIGLFLGYPAEDVHGFIHQGPEGCKCTGAWKVYGDEEAAKKKFACYKHCTRIYRARWENGTNIDRLTVAG